MILTTTKSRLAILLSLVTIVLINAGVSSAQTSTVLPQPSLMFIGPEFYEANGKSWIRYRYAVDNRAAFPDSLFAAAPQLAPCGSNTRASRTWIDFYDSTGKRLYGFCALGKSSDLASLWFAMEVNVIPPSWVYIEMNDRQTGTKVKSILAETTQ